MLRDHGAEYPIAEFAACGWGVDWSDTVEERFLSALGMTVMLNSGDGHFVERQPQKA
jgi:hypothetical protein